MSGFFIYYFLQPKSFESTISLYPSYQSEGSVGSNLLSLASEFGVGKKINSQDAVIYTPDIINSFSLKKSILLNEYDSLNGQTLIDYYISNEFSFLKTEVNYEKKIQSYAKLLDDMIFISLGRVSGLITIKTYFSTVSLSEEVCENILIYLKDFINESSIEISKARVLYFEDRLADISQDLTFAEKNLEDFLMDNKDIESPLLQTQYLRLMRDVELNNQNYMFLKQQIENEKIQLKKNELNFVISDKFTDLEEKKTSFLILVFNYLLILSFLYLWSFNDGKLIISISNYIRNKS